MKIKVIDRSGNGSEIPAEVGMSIESAITQAGVQDSFGICGGACACASCQVYVAKEDYDKLTAPDEGETAVLEDMAYELQPTSRLSCQIEVNPNMEGMTFTIAPY